MPTNHVTGSGTATVQLNGDVATVTVDTNGLLNGSPHAMHIHAGGQGVCPPASAARLHNGHLSISTTNGIKFYGPPQVALTSTGDTSPKSIVDFSRYPTTGDIRYTRTITIPPGVAGAIRAGNAVDHRARHRLQPQRHLRQRPGSQRAEQQPARRGDRAGALRPPGRDQDRVRGDRDRPRPATYAVVLHRDRRAAATPGTGFALLCHLLGVDAAALSDRAAEPAPRPDPPRGHRETTIVAFIHGWSEQK